MKVIELFALHLKDAKKRVAAKKLSPKTVSDYVNLQGLIFFADLLETDADILGPAHFVRLMEEIEARNYSLRTQKNIIASLKSVFNWGGPEGMNYILKPVYGPRFRAPKIRAIEAEQEEKPSRFLDNGLILQILDVASPKMKVAILLGINCGFYPSDTFALTMGRVHLDHDPPYHDMRRMKTLQQRRAMLWPETVEAIEAITSYGVVFTSTPSDYIMLLPNCKPYSLTGDMMAGSFRRLLKKVGHKVPGVGLGSLRHTYATVIDTVPDQAMIDLTMGHTNPSIQKRTYRQLNTNEFSRLQVIANTVHLWLFDTELPFKPF